MPSQPKRIMLVVGEASGDLYGAQLVNHLYQHDPSLDIYGVAGENLKREGIRVLFDVARLFSRSGGVVHMASLVFLVDLVYLVVSSIWPVPSISSISSILSVSVFRLFRHVIVTGRPDRPDDQRNQIIQSTGYGGHRDTYPIRLFDQLFFF